MSEIPRNTPLAPPLLGPPPPPPLKLLSTPSFVPTTPFEHRSINRQLIIDELKSLGKCELELKTTAAAGSCSSAMLIISSVVQPILQHGPICGLVALAMANLTSNPDDETTSKILHEAKERAFTKNGEMFSASNMLELANSVTNFKAKILSDEDDIKRSVLFDCLNGDHLLVPYDADKNHRPGLLNGHSAHWAIVHGFAIILNDEYLNIFKSLFLLPNSDLVDFKSDPIFFIDCEKLINNDQRESLRQFIQNLKIEEDDIYVVARQGKSTHVGLWTFKELMDSNNNLKEISPAILAKESEYVLSDIKMDLRSKVILLTRPFNT